MVFGLNIFILVYLSFDEKSQRVHLCAWLTAASWTKEPFGEIGANFSLQLSLRTQIAKINNKKVVTENRPGAKYFEKYSNTLQLL